MRRSLDNPSEELSESFTQAYGGSLKPYHSFVIKPIFTVSLEHDLLAPVFIFDIPRAHLCSTHPCPLILFADGHEGLPIPQ